MALKYQKGCLLEYCNHCQEETQHLYQYDAPYPDLPTIMAGSERKTCQKCKTTTHVSSATYQEASKRYAEEVLPNFYRQN